MVMVDTDIIIWILKGNDDIKSKFRDITNQTDGLMFLTPIQIAEIYAGIRENERVSTEIFLDSFIVLTVDGKTGKLAGEFVNKYKKSHNVLIGDAIIAAVTKLHGLKLWTLNKKHYPMLEMNELV